MNFCVRAEQATATEVDRGNHAGAAVCLHQPIRFREPCRRSTRMNITRAVALAVLLLFVGTANAQDGTPLKLVHTIPLPGLKDGDFDHFAPDVEGHRLFLTAEENGKVEVLDTNTNKVTHTIDDLKAPH